MEGRRINGQIGVIGGGQCPQDIGDIAREVGREIAIAFKVEKPIVGIKTWTLEGRFPQAECGQEAMDMLMAMLQR